MEAQIAALSDVSSETEVPVTETYMPVEADFLPSPPKIAGPLSAVPSPGLAKPALIAFIFFTIASAAYWRDPEASQLAVSGEAVFKNHQYWRLFTALFTHSDFGHLLSNMPLFLIFGWYLRAFFGVWTFPVASFFIGVASNLATIYFYPPTAQLIGASGMLYGMVALWLVLYVKFDIDHSVFMRFFRALGFSIGVLFPTTFQPTTSYLAHAAGFAIGAILGLAMMPLLHVHDSKRGLEAGHAPKLQD